MGMRRAGILRQAIFSAIGLLPVACGGTSTSSTGGGGSGAGGSPAASGASGSGGAASVPSGGSGAVDGGAPSAGTSSGGRAGTAGSAGSAGEGGALSGEPRFPCESSMPAGEAHPGFARCEGVGWHRPEAKVCPPSAVVELSLGLGCENDAECGGGKICVCGPTSQCAKATCVTDADCAEGFLCLGYSTALCDGPGLVLPNGFACQTPDDACATWQGCTDGRRCGAESGKFQCDVAPTYPGCGRPFLVSGAERVAPVSDRADWLETAVSAEIPLPSSELRAAAAAAWSRIGQLEHASIAAFARFTLQLLQLGAPADLVERAARATQEEIQHARLAFALASRLAGKSVGPSALDVDHSLEQISLADVLRLVVREGCIGETVAALQVSEAAAVATSAGLRLALEAVAKEEAEHAELAWRFVRWALERQPTLSVVLREELSSAQRAPLAGSLTADDRLAAVGILCPAAEAEIRATALREVIEPCSHGLLAALSS